LLWLQRKFLPSQFSPSGEKKPNTKPKHHQSHPCPTQLLGGTQFQALCCSPACPKSPCPQQCRDISPRSRCCQCPAPAAPGSTGLRSRGLRQERRQRPEKGSPWRHAAPQGLHAPEGLAHHAQVACNAGN